MTKDQAQAAIRRLEDLSKSFGCADTEASSEMSKLLRELWNFGPNDGYYREKIGSLEQWVDIGFSTRKHQKYSGGASQVTVWALGDIGTLESLVSEHWSSN